MEEETVEHVINCGCDEKMNPMCINNIDLVDQSMECKLISFATRINNFLDMVDF